MKRIGIAACVAVAVFAIFAAISYGAESAAPQPTGDLPVAAGVIGLALLLARMLDKAFDRLVPAKPDASSDASMAVIHSTLTRIESILEKHDLPRMAEKIERLETDVASKADARSTEAAHARLRDDIRQIPSQLMTALQRHDSPPGGMSR